MAMVVIFICISQLYFLCTGYAFIFKFNITSVDFAKYLASILISKLT